MTINLNLLPWRESQKEQQKREFLSWIGLGFATASSLMILIHILISRQIAFQNENNGYLKNEIKKLDEQIAEIQTLQKEKEQLLARMEIIQQLQTNRPQIVRLFDVIVHTVPEGLYLTNLTRTGNNIVTDGKAESNTRVSTFMRNIEASHWLKDPVLTLIQADNKDNAATNAAPNAKTNEKMADRMIGFNLQVQESVQSQANLNKLIKENKNTTGNTVVPATQKNPSPQPK
ncbi:MAG: PilN domain-containing protein [Proteobacteria bacterium]|nr:PilN domain-containing protein [Pseudomonadota bacterium]